MRTLLPLLSIVLPVTAVCIVGGCTPSRQATPSADSPDSRTASTQPAHSSASPRPITRTEEVPNGHTTGLGFTLPQGFKINVFANGLRGPRRLMIAPGGTPQKYDVFVVESPADRIRVLRELDGNGIADANFTFTDKLNQPYGLAFHPRGWLYVGNTDAVVRFPYRPGDTSTTADSQFIARLMEGGYNAHWTRNLLFSRDYKKLYVTVGSSCNTCEEEDPQRAAISIMNPDGSGHRLFATGLRNPVGMDWRPGTNELWAVVNERDRLGDDVPPDYFTVVKDGDFYGWPYAYADINGDIVPDPEYGSKNPEKIRKTVIPTVPVQAHSAPLGVAFYAINGTAHASGPNNDQSVTKTGAKLFPKEYSGDAFLTYHGSTSRSERTGYKVVRVNFEKGQPVSVTDFMRGYLRDGQVWGRPVDITVAPDGSLLFTDDGSHKVWRVSYVGNSR